MTSASQVAAKATIESLPSENLNQGFPGGIYISPKKKDTPLLKINLNNLFSNIFNEIDFLLSRLISDF